MAQLGPFSSPNDPAVTPEAQKVKDALDVLNNAVEKLATKIISDSNVWQTFINLSQTPAGYLTVDSLVFWEKAVMADSQIMREAAQLINDVKNWGLNAPPNVPEGTALKDFPTMPKDLSDYIKSLPVS